MSTFTIDLTGQQVLSERSGGFAPIPADTYNGFIYDIEQKEFTSEANAGKPYFNIQLRISDGEYSGRVLFAMVPLFTAWGPTAKNPEGSDAFTFYDFFGPMLGLSSKEFREKVAEAATSKKKHIALPSPHDLMGREIAFKVVVKPDHFAFNRAKNEAEESGIEFTETIEDYKRNEVTKYFGKPLKKKSKSKAKAKAKADDGYDL